MHKSQFSELANDDFCCISRSILQKSLMETRDPHYNQTNPAFQRDHISKADLDFEPSITVILLAVSIDQKQYSGE